MKQLYGYFSCVSLAIFTWYFVFENNNKKKNKRENTDERTQYLEKQKK